MISPYTICKIPKPNAQKTKPQPTKNKESKPKAISK